MKDTDEIIYCISYERKKGRIISYERKVIIVIIIVMMCNILVIINDVSYL